MKKLVIFFFILPVFSLGQEVQITFEDQDLTDWYQNSEHHWAIVSENPITGDYSLSHSFNSEEDGTDWITLFHWPLDLKNNATTWKFSLRYSYNPSSNNHWAVMFGTDCLPDEKLQAEKALILGVNYTGNDDILKVWGTGEGEISLILNTSFNWEEQVKKKQIIDFRVTISAEQDIAIEIDTTGDQFVLLGKGELIWDDKINNFGVLYKYTSSYDRGLAIDNLTISGKMAEDYLAPVVQQVCILNQEEIKIRFSEMIQSTTQSECCIEGIGCHSIDNVLANNIMVRLQAPMIPGNNYSMRISGISDVYKNRSAEITYIFYYPAPYDVVINEIMPDPDPPILLPEAEYIELFNRSDKMFSIEDWYLSINTKTHQLSSYIIQPGEYVILCDEEYTSLFEHNVIPIKSMGSIHNSDAQILLQDASGKLIHAARYNSNRIDDINKKEGGWSMELIDPYNPCVLRDNWSSTLDYRGGTPGEENSVLSLWRGQANPELWRTAVTDSGSVKLYFSEPIDSLQSINTSFYNVDRSIGHPIELHLAWPFAEQMELIFDRDFEKGKEYQLSITRDPCDCSGNPFIGVENNRFFVPQASDSADVIINEIMFEPAEACIEYIELYNRSEKTIELKDWQLKVGDRSAGILTIEYFPLNSGAYGIIAPDIKGINDPGRFTDPQLIIEMPDMPSLSNNGTIIQLLNKNGRLIDQVQYDPLWHHELYANTRGKALERISANGSGTDQYNWQSASSTSGYQTPGTINSQAVQSENLNQITITPETITPNADGLDDELNICYRLDGSDYMARVLIFDLNGRLRKTIANGSIPGAEGCYYFNGKGEDEDTLPTGYYVLYFEAYNQKGKRIRKKGCFVIAVEN